VSSYDLFFSRIQIFCLASVSETIICVNETWQKHESVSCIVLEKWSIRCIRIYKIVRVFWFVHWRLCFGRGRDKSFVFYIFLFLRVLGWRVCVCLYTRVHTHKRLGYLMWAQVWDGHLESRKNPDRLKRSIHVDRIGVHSTFVYIYAGLRVLKIWANCLFSFNMSFLLRKVEDVTTISKSHSLTSVSIKDCTLRVQNETTTLFLLPVIIKAIFIQQTYHDEADTFVATAM